MEKAGHKRQKGEAAQMAAKKRTLEKFLGGDSQPQYADPSALYEASKG